MTRYARSGSSQKHKKMPGDATPWSEFSKQRRMAQPKKKGIFKGPKKNFHHLKKKEKFVRYFQENEETGNHSNIQDVSCDSANKTEISNEQDSRKPTEIKKTNEESQGNKEFSNEFISQSSTSENGKPQMKRKKFKKNNGIFLDKSVSVGDKPNSNSSSQNVSKHESQRRKKGLQALKRKRIAKPCFNCRKTDHLLADCPEKLSGAQNQAIGICFKCGSADHTSYKCPNKVIGFPFAKCFICKEQGHISRDCPKNNHGVYIKGGQCNHCGNVNHLKKDCPQLNKKTEEESLATAHIIKEGSSIDEEIIIQPKIHPKGVKKPKVVKF